MYSTLLRMGAKDVELVYKFTYLGTVVTETGGIEEDISLSIVKGWKTFA